MSHGELHVETNRTAAGQDRDSQVGHMLLVTAAESARIRAHSLPKRDCNDDEKLLVAGRKVRGQGLMVPSLT